MSTWSSIASQGVAASSQGTRTFASSSNSNEPPIKIPAPRKRSTSPSHKPQTQTDNEQTYVLTLITDKRHHDTLTAMRKRYFPPKINKLEAHLTLFHALPESCLQSAIIPHIETVCASTSPFNIHASHPFRLKRGVAITVPKHEGGAEAQGVHKALQDEWRGGGWLSEQDAGGFRVHYTIQNKVDDEEVVEKTLAEVKKSWRGDWGRVEGVGLWRYERGHWKWERGFEFTEGKEKSGGRAQQS